MAKKPLTAVRLPDETLERLDALVPILAATPEGAAGNVSRSYVLRRALAIGLDALESEYPAKRRK
jgi:predicted DNA-binding protein